MKPPESLVKLFRPRVLSRGRIWAAFVVAIVADGVQLLAGPLGWAAFDQTVDVLAMAITTQILGFHPLLLPTFVVELVPVLDMLPTWTGCVAAVVVIRKREQNANAQPPLKSLPGPPEKPAP